MTLKFQIPDVTKLIHMLFFSLSGIYKPTVGVDFRAKQLNIEGEYVRALIWDTAG